MERKGANPPPPSSGTRPLPIRPPVAGWESNLTGSTSSSSSSSISPPNFLRHVQAALKRHRPTGMHANGPRARRVLVPSGDVAPSADSCISSARNTSPRISAVADVASSSEANCDPPAGVEADIKPPPPENASVVSLSVRQIGTAIKRDEAFPLPGECETPLPGDCLKPPTIPVDEESKVPCSLRGDDVSASFESAITKMTNHYNISDISSHLTSLALAEREEISGVVDPDIRQQDFQSAQMLGRNTMTGEAHLMEKRAGHVNNQTFPDPMTQGLVASSSVTALSLHPRQASQCPRLVLAGAGQNAIPTQVSYAVKGELRVQESIPPEARGTEMKEGETIEQKRMETLSDVAAHRKVSGDAGIQQQTSSIRGSSLHVKAEPSQSNKTEKVSRKKKYDADSFFKVNGKLYQKLGKIGSGGSSEVYKVITSDCTIYALKKIALKGRDYLTAHGFYQEIEYLRKLKGKSNIIQLIDYEVTDDALLEEIMNQRFSVKNRRIKDDVHIYMLLEYGEIDLAHMLLQKWKEFDKSSWKVNENWLRFYWQQMLEAVNTIHEERIVHSDLKPANFLLVRGSLKLIDFGIAKAISSDTTNIQRDSQVGTLNYMSPEAYMCNEIDTNGNTIKCGRPSDIWSLGCILYQMVYGKTPFADYKTVWAKYKVVTDKKHQIEYEQVSNPCLIDLMKKCLAWDRNERWRIPQLLQHPFLVPQIPQDSNFLLQKIDVYSHVPEVSKLLCQLQNLIADLEEGSTESPRPV